jgi:HSP20 family protein
MLLDRHDPFLADFDQLAQRVFGRAETSGMPMDVTRRGEELVLRVDLPGVEADKVSLTVENQTLTISAERRNGYGDEEQLLLQERFEGSLTRRIRLPEFVDTERVTAEHVDGVLTITLPVAEQARPRQIQVQPGAGTSAGSAGSAHQQISA